jgi:hypothetical protein
VTFKRALLSVAALAALVLAATIALAFYMRFPHDISRDNTRNGGYHPGDRYRTRIPLILSRYTGEALLHRQPVPNPSDAELAASGAIRIPDGATLQITRVVWDPGSPFADHAAHAIPYAQILTGPGAGAEANLRSISNEKEINSAGHTIALLDTAILQPEPP